MQFQQYSNGDELNLAIENIVCQSTRQINIKSDLRLKRRHVNIELVTEIRRRGRTV